MRLGEVIEVLKGMPADAVIRPGFHNVCSVRTVGRGFALGVDFPESHPQTVTEALDAIRTAIASSSLLDSQAYMSTSGMSPEPITRLWLMSATVPVDIVFGGGGGPDGGTFVETEDGRRYSVGCGEWVEREEGLHALRINVAMGDIKRSKAPEVGS